jgi:MOSC domain-containing protein YiiM
VTLEVTQIGKKCHSGCAIFKEVGNCIMPKEGVFARVITGGTIRPGDEIQVID